MNAVVDFPTLSTLNAYTQIELEFDRELGTPLFMDEAIS